MTVLRSLLLTSVFLSACAVDTTFDDAAGDEAGVSDRGITPLSSTERNQLASRIRSQFSARRITPIPSATIPGTQARRDALVALGQALAFDKILSDNKDVSCMTCHPPAVGSDDDRALSMGVGGVGLGANRTGGVVIARNAPPLFNLHTTNSLFWDGRVERLADGTYRTPAGPQLTPAMTGVFEFGALSAFSLFPPTSHEEMRGRVDGLYDDLASVPDGDFTGLWNAEMNRLRAIPKYRQMFGDAYPDWPGARDQRIDTMTFAHASNAIAAFLVAKFTSKDSPWDDFVAGNDAAFKVIEDYTKNSPPVIYERDVLLGADRFLQTCANCHNGPTLSDNRYHNTAIAQLGPGAGDGDSLRDDFGRERVVGANAHLCGTPGSNASCKYAFRTTPLRNVILTAPYGHAGEFGRVGNDPDFGVDARNDMADLRNFLAHYAVNPADNLRSWSGDELDTDYRATVVDNYDDIIANIDPLFANGSPVGPADLDILTAFMAAQTSKAIFTKGLDTGLSGRYALCGVIPASVPSGLPLDADASDEDDCKSDGKDNDSF